MKNTVIIKDKKTFRYLLNKGNIYKNENLVLYAINSKEKSKLFGVCVSKKNGTAVHRNKMKRWAREVYKTEEINLKNNIILIVLYKKTTTINNLNYHVVKDQIVKGFKELNLYENC